MNECEVYVTFPMRATTYFESFLFTFSLVTISELDGIECPFS